MASKVDFSSAQKAYVMLEILFDESDNLPGSEGRIVYCGARKMRKQGWSCTNISSAFNTLKRHGLMESSSHNHNGKDGIGRCGNQVILKKGLLVVEQRRQITPPPAVTEKSPKKEVSEVPSWCTDTGRIDQSKPIVVEEKKSETETPVASPVRGVFTEIEKMAADLLVTLAKKVVNGKTELRVVEPTQMLVEGGVASNTRRAMEIVNSLVSRGILVKIQEREISGGVRATYRVMTEFVSAHKVATAQNVESALKIQLDGADAKIAELQQKRENLLAERREIEEKLGLVNEDLKNLLVKRDKISGRMDRLSHLLCEAVEGLG